MRRFAASILALILLAAGLRAAEMIPPAPRDHFNDYAGVIDPAVARQLNEELAQFERDSSNQIVVVVFPKMQSGSTASDYTFRVAQEWGVGTKGRSNGAAMFVFIQDREMYIQVGYGLEGVLPDALCRQIIANDITPKFRTGDYTGGLTTGVSAMIAAAKGEYRGSGQTVRENRRGGERSFGSRTFAMWFVIVMLVFSFRAALRRRSVYSGTGRNDTWSGGGWGGGGGRGGGGGGTFSGGGGSFGGGGAGGRW
jgi:uncharacterized protein